MVSFCDVQTEHIPTVPAVDLLFANDLATLVLQRALQEGHFSFPECRSDPIVCLLVEEGQVGDFMRPQINHVLRCLVVEDGAREDIVHLNAAAVERHRDNPAIW